MSSPPTVAVLVLNLNGQRHLSACLPGLEAQVYPNREIVVVDNGSTDDSLSFVRQEHPSVRVLEMGRNAGFCGAYNHAVQTVDAEWVALLNNDTRVEPDWLSELMAAADRHRASVVASRMLDWEGAQIDFVGGTTSFEGHSWQIDHGKPVGPVPDERDLLFACGGSMLASRAAFLDAGGFDEDFFAYFEDVDLGWRLSVLGHRIVLAPRAITYHRLHGTSGSLAVAQRLRLYERNALAMLVKNYEDETLARAFPAAVALSLYRALVRAGVDPTQFVLGERRPPGVVGLPAPAAAHLVALEDLGRWMPALLAKRAAIQTRRRRSDRELTALFGDPFRLHDVDDRYVAIAQALIADFGLDAIFAQRRYSDAPPAPLKGRPTNEGVAPPHGLTYGPTYVGHRFSGAEIDADLPTITVIIPTMLGPVHLPTCLRALAEQDYPSDKIDIIVVNNGGRSIDSLVARSGVRGQVLKPGRNLGFAAANNLGVRHATGQFVAFLNDDTRADRAWLSRSVDVARRRGAVAVAAHVVDWEGQLVDFAGGSVNFEGKGFQEFVNAARADVPLEERPVLFANGAAMLVDRHALVDAGQWDEGTFAYYEDVELGWRLWLLGHEVWFAPDAVVHHRHHGTSGRWPEPPRARLLERNSLRMIYALLERETLSQALPAALLLGADRAFLQTALHRGGDHEALVAAELPAPTIGERARAAVRLRGARRDLPIAVNLRRVGLRGLAGAARDTLLRRPGIAATPQSRDMYFIERGRQGRELDGRRDALPADAAARLLGIQDFLRDLPALSGRRAEIQSRRQRSDAEILSRFGTNWLSPVPSKYQALHNELHAALVDAFGLAPRQA
jgi:GT2 family glycosyltransferase